MPNIHPDLQGVATNRLTPAEAAAAFRITTVTLTKWAQMGKIPCTRMPNGHRRFREDDVIAMLKGEQDFTGRTDLETYRHEDD